MRILPFTTIVPTYTHTPWKKSAWSLLWLIMLQNWRKSCSLHKISSFFSWLSSSFGMTENIFKLHFLHTGLRHSTRGPATAASPTWTVTPCRGPRSLPSRETTSTSRTTASTTQSSSATSSSSKTGSWRRWTLSIRWKNNFFPYYYKIIICWLACILCSRRQDQIIDGDIIFTLSIGNTRWIKNT